MSEINPYKELFSALARPALLLKPEGSKFRIIDVNHSFSSMTGRREEDFIGRTTDEDCPDNPNFKDYGFYISQASLQKAYQSGKTNKVEVIRNCPPHPETGYSEKKWFCCESIPLRNKNGKVDFVVNTVEDITEKVLLREREKEIRQQLLRQQEKWRHFVENNPDGLYSMDLNGKFTSANEGLLKLAETPLDQILTQTFLPFCAPNDQQQIVEHFKQAVKGKNVTFEAGFVSAKGNEMVLKISLLPIRVKGKIIGVYGIAKDITSIRYSERLVVEKKKFLEVNASFIKSLLENELEDKALQEAFAIIGKTVAVDRMYYFGAHTDEATNEIYISQKIEWTSERATPQIDNAELRNMPASRVEEIMGPLKKNLPFRATLSELPDSTLKDLYVNQDIKSMLLLPIFLHNRLHGFIGFDDCLQEREWTEDEVTFLQSLAHYFTNALEKRSAERAVKQREEELKRSEQKFKALVQEGSDLIAILDLEGNYLFVSETSTPLLGLPPENLVGKNAFEFIHPDDRSVVKERFSDLHEKRHIIIEPFRFQDSEGKWRWIETSATNLMKDPAVQGIVANSRDVTTVLEQAKEIDSINERYRLAAIATNDLIYDWDLEGNEVVRFHRNPENLFGYPAEELNSRGFWRSNVHPDDLSKELKKLKKALQNPAENIIKTEYRFRRADGTYAKVIDKGYIIRDPNGRAIRLVGASSDVSDILAKEEALQIANKRFKMAMKATNEIIWDWDIATDYVNRSKSFGKIYGYKGSGHPEMQGFWIQRIASKDKERVQKSLSAALQNPKNKKWKQEYRFLKANGEIAYVVDRGYIIRDKSGRAIRMVGAVLDVTASRQLLQEIKKQNRVLREIAWEQSHIVRAPLARLKGLLHLLQIREFGELSEEEILRNIHRSADELDEIIRGIVKKSEKIEFSHQSSKKI